MTYKYDWVKFYTEFADKLLEYENNREELINKISKVYERINIKLPKLESDNENNKILPYDIDPFTIFALFNKGITLENRIKIITELKKEFNIKSKVPKVFDGASVIYNLKSVFYYFKDDREEDDIDNLWNVFKYGLEYSKTKDNESRENFIKYYNKALGQKGVKWNITIGLYWINPYFYINLDKPSRDFLSNSENIETKISKEIEDLNKPPKGNKYLNFCENIKNELKTEKYEYKNLVELSIEAVNYSNTNNDPSIGDDDIETVNYPDRNEDSGIGDEDIETVNYWLFSPGQGARCWNTFLKKSVFAVGWEDIGDLQKYNNKEEIIKKLQEAYNDNKKHTMDANALWDFKNVIKAKDIIFAKKGNHKIIGMGIVEDSYYYDNKYEYKHRRKIKWVSTGEWEYTESTFPQKTLTNITNNKELVNNIKSLIDYDDDYDETPVTNYPEYTREDFLDEVYITDEKYEDIKELLNFKKNLIIQGPPGTGKTFLAKRLAYSLMGLKDSSRVEMVQFHQSYSYEDFVMGYKPVERGFKIKEGSFYSFCKKAEEDSENNYYFIIDGINRGNLSKIFGELFMLIEKDKRGDKNKIQLVYNNESFSIPKNLYLIGLMNTSDRSLAMIDFALRRRFAFYTLEASFTSDGFRQYQSNLNSETFNKVISIMEDLNNTISIDENLGSGFTIGHSYFSNLKVENLDKTLKHIIEYEIIPLLQEYWFDEEDKVEEWSNQLRSVIQ